MTDYGYINSALRELTDGVEHDVTNLANASALLFCSLEKINWAGFYIYRDGSLILGPFQGKPACTLIGPGKGVCGSAAISDSTVVVPDVHLFPGHIACDCASESEIVIPVHFAGALYGVLDIDSPVKERFSCEDRKGLESFVNILEERLKGDLK